jgi:fatty acid desaturase
VIATAIKFHLYPFIPFHALPQAHQQLKEHFTVIKNGYAKVSFYLLVC